MLLLSFAGLTPQQQAPAGSKIRLPLRVSFFFFFSNTDLGWAIRNFWGEEEGARARARVRAKQVVTSPSYLGRVERISHFSVSFIQINPRLIFIEAWTLTGYYSYQSFFNNWNSQANVSHYVATGLITHLMILVNDLFIRLDQISVELLEMETDLTKKEGSGVY